MDFAGLHTHSIFSIRDSIAKIPDLVKQAVELKIPALALTDHGVTTGHVQHYQTCQKNGIKPLLGAELYIAPGSRFDKDKTRKYGHITLIAMNSTGFKNLNILASEANRRECFYSKPRIDRELLYKHNEGLICLSGCMASQLSHAILKELKPKTPEEGVAPHIPISECSDCRDIQSEGNQGRCSKHSDMSIDETVDWYKKVFGDRYYLEIQNHGIDDETLIRNTLLELSKKKGIKTVATGDTHFIKKEDAYAHNIMIAIRDKTTIHNENLHRYNGDGYYLPDQEYLDTKFSFSKESVTNTLEIAERCNLSFKFGDYKIAHKPGVDIRNEDKVFHDAVFEGLTKIFGTIPANYIQRAEEELAVIIQMTFPNYFLIVQDYVNWAKRQGILVGPARGSAGGSLVSYALGITSVDPVKYDLSFSRFLNSGRASRPQINFPEYPLAQWQHN